MKIENLVHKCSMHIAGSDYEVLVYSRTDGTHIAKTFFDSHDVIINDGPSLDDALSRHRALLPLAINSREILRQLRGPAD